MPFNLTTQTFPLSDPPNENLHELAIKIDSWNYNSWKFPPYQVYLELDIVVLYANYSSKYPSLN